MMQAVPDSLLEKLRHYRQEHVVADWERLTPETRQELIEQLQTIDFAELESLYERRDVKDALPPGDRIKPLPRPPEDPSQLNAFRQRGEQAFERGEVAFLVVAGGQGSRLGFEQAKGLFPIGPISGKTLFQLHVEKVIALERKYRRAIPFLVMTSPATDMETRAYFRDHQAFGLQDVRIFQQGTMPALDLETGRLLLEAPGKLFLSPNGHGGTLTGLAESKLIEALKRAGVRVVSYFQVDNPLTILADYEFVGHHLLRGAHASSKVIDKKHATEKVGNLVLIDGRKGIIEYSDLPDELAHAKDEQGRLKLWAGNPAIHLFDVEFLDRVTTGLDAIPWHVAKKKVPCLAPDGSKLQPTKENALKFERFIFDVLPKADQWTVQTTSRPREFEPVKNATGADSPASCRQALINLAGANLEEIGVKVPRDAEGNVTIPIEISPLFASSPEELKAKIGNLREVTQPAHLQ
ncbi:MAG: UTP--glucose-1-phosphate uridylyltransferase [Gemmataceae bacterium]|nr:UTP--glucose-1-phosphate uridylyltransferase [Gemmataceae bacterium]